MRMPNFMVLELISFNLIMSAYSISNTMALVLFACIDTYLGT